MKKITDRLKTLRGSKSQAEFAKSLGLTQVAYGRYELGTREPSIDLLIHIAKELSVSIDWLVGLTENQTGLNKIGKLTSKSGVKSKIRELKSYATQASEKADELLSVIEKMEGTL